MSKYHKVPKLSNGINLLVITLEGDFRFALPTSNPHNIKDITHYFQDYMS